VKKNDFSIDKATPGGAEGTFEEKTGVENHPRTKNERGKKPVRTSEAKKKGKGAKKRDNN